MSALELHDVVVDYHGRGGRVRAVAGASLSVERGTIVGLVGESGCGKSTLARAAVGLVETTSGTVTFEGRPGDLARPAGAPGRARRLQLVFQNPYSSLNPRRTIGSQVADGARAGCSGTRACASCSSSSACPRTPSRAIPHEFSGGQRQRIAIARALAADPSVIVLDEPLASLDASAQAQLANLLKRLSRELDVGLLLISHDLAIVRHVADDVSRDVPRPDGRDRPDRSRSGSSPAHPYTEALIAAVPRADGAGVLPRGAARRGARTRRIRRPAAASTRAARTRSTAARSRSRRCWS